MMRDAPQSAAPWMTFRPTPPQPKTATVCPGRTFAVLIDRADAGHDAAADQAGAVERHVVGDLDRRGGAHHRVLGERADAGHARDRRCRPSEDVLLARHQPLLARLAEVHRAGDAVVTAAAVLDPGEHDVIAGLERA